MASKQSKRGTSKRCFRFPGAVTSAFRRVLLASSWLVILAACLLWGLSYFQAPLAYRQWVWRDGRRWGCYRQGHEYAQVVRGEIYYSRMDLFTNDGGIDYGAPLYGPPPAPEDESTIALAKLPPPRPYAADSDMRPGTHFRWGEFSFHHVSQRQAVEVRPPLPSAAQRKTDAADLAVGRLRSGSTTAGDVETSIRAPCWFLAGTLALAPAVSLLDWARRRRSDRLKRTGLCPECGYDLRATAGRCPECGALAAPGMPAAEGTSGAASDHSARGVSPPLGGDPARARGASTLGKGRRFADAVLVLWAAMLGGSVAAACLYERSISRETRLTANLQPPEAREGAAGLAAGAPRLNETTESTRPSNPDRQAGPARSGGLSEATGSHEPPEPLSRPADDWLAGVTDLTAGAATAEMELDDARAVVMAQAAVARSADDARAKAVLDRLTPYRDPAAVRRAAEAGDARAMARLAWRFYNGDGVPYDYEQGFEWAKKAADAGNTAGMLVVAHACQIGLGTLLDQVGAFGWLRKAAAAGDPAGMRRLGDASRWGKGVPVADKPQALRWFHKSLEAGDADAAVDLGDLYSVGMGAVRRDPARAVSYYRWAAESGDPRGMQALGVCYATGRGVGPDVAKARRWLEACGEAAGAESRFRLALLLLTRHGALAPDEGGALRWFRASAEDGNRNAMEVVGRMYQRGQGTPPDDAEATRWFRRGAEAGNRDAMRETALAYHRGVGVERDEVESKRWSEAADEDAARARRAVGQAGVQSR